MRSLNPLIFPLKFKKIVVTRKSKQNCSGQNDLDLGKIVLERFRDCSYLYMHIPDRSLTGIFPA